MVLTVRALAKNFGSFRAIRDLSFSVGPGEVVGLLGPRGSGKTTVLRLIAGELDGSDGSISVGGVSVARRDRRAFKNFSFVPADGPLPDAMTPYGYLSLRASLRGLLDIRREVVRALQRCDLLRLARRQPIGDLGGELRKRVAVAEALMGKPKLLLLDEAAADLSPSTAKSLFLSIGAMEQRPAVLVSGQTPWELEPLCQRFLLLGGGRLLGDGSIRSLGQLFLKSPWPHAGRRPPSPLESIFLAAMDGNR
ncbi:MAG: ABC transporter ATP-binding protein [Puniceicoccales bacterium]|nr:ABC transporter ATP-binding protein [Puniceicoccales bacterium]